MKVVQCRDCKVVIASYLADPDTPETKDAVLSGFRHTTKDGKNHTDMSIIEIEDGEAEKYIAGAESVDELHARLGTAYKDQFT